MDSEQVIVTRDLTVKELAELAQVDGSYIRRLLLSGKLRGEKRAGAWFITRKAAEQWLNERGGSSRR